MVNKTVDPIYVGSKNCEKIREWLKSKGCSEENYLGHPVIYMDKACEIKSGVGSKD